MSNDLNVVRFYDDGFHDYIARDVSDYAAVRIAHRCSESLLARLGAITRIIITDAEDYTVFEWQSGKGVTFPPREEPSP